MGLKINYNKTEYMFIDREDSILNTREQSYRNIESQQKMRKTRLDQDKHYPGLTRYNME